MAGLVLHCGYLVAKSIKTVSYNEQCFMGA